MRRGSLVVTVCAVILALTAVMGFLPFVFLLPALLASCCFGYRISFFASLAFGVISLIYSIPSVGLLYGSVSWYFVNYPWLPIVARMFIGPITHAFFLLSKRLTKNLNQKGESISIALSAAIGSLTNTILVGGIILLIGSDVLPMHLDKVTLGMLAFFGSIEIFVTALALPLIIYALKKASPKLFIQMKSPIYIKKREPSQVKEDNQ